LQVASFHEGSLPADHSFLLYHLLTQEDPAFMIKGGYLRGVRTAIPILIGYFPAAMTYGLIAKNMDIDLLHTCLMSVMVFAGASQFMALNLIKGGIATGEIIIATLLMNFRHFLMSASLSSRMEKESRFLPVVAFGITDETFAIASTRNEKLSSGFLIGLESIAYSSWIAGTAVGHTLGRVLPDAIQRSLGIALYALFIAIIVPAVKRSFKAAAIALISAGCHVLLSELKLLSSGWNIIIAILAGAAAGSLLFSNSSDEKSRRVNT
jgi:4-azaleucine resistance transporter AzlC